MTVTWSNVDDAHMDGLNMMVYGPAGVGKTRLIGTLPQPIIISSERGNLTLKGKGIPVAYIQNGKDLKEVYDEIVRDAGRTFKSVALDSMTDICETMLGISKKLNKADPRKAYFEVAELGHDWMKKFRDLPGIHKYFVAQLGETKDEVTGQKQYAPSFPGKALGQDAPYLFDILAYAGVYVDPETQERHHYLKCQPDQQYQAKDRSGVLGDFEQPDFAQILNKISGVL
ncbi:AAA family ATPase [Xanthomonas citri pv. citri]|nr:putative ATPase AAA [Achromobacter phage vB_Ade_ART]MBD4204909.1 AAA family ATPase [Xanthomonas citri pv. citri]